MIIDSQNLVFYDKAKFNKVVLVCSVILNELSSLNVSKKLCSLIKRALCFKNRKIYGRQINITIINIKLKAFMLTLILSVLYSVTINSN